MSLEKLDTVSLNKLYSAQCWLGVHFLKIQLDSKKKKSNLNMEPIINDVTQVMKNILENSQLREFFRLDVAADNFTTQFDEVTYEKTIKPLLVEKIVTLIKHSKLSNPEIEKIHLFLSGNYAHPHFEEAVQFIEKAEDKFRNRVYSACRLMNNIPQAITYRLGIDYGRTSSSRVAVPFKTVEYMSLPIEDCQFESPYMQMLLTMLSYLRQNQS